MIEEYYDFSSTMGFKIIAVDYLGNSTLQLLKLQNDVDSAIMVQIENDATIISVFDKDVLQLQRTVPYGKTMIVNAVMEKRKIFNYDVALDILTKEKLIHEEFDGDEITESMKYLVSNVSRIMDYQVSRNSNKPIDKVYIVGNATYILGLEDLFKSQLSAPVESISFLKGVSADKRTYVEETTLTTYIANIGAVIDPINFVPNSMTESKKGGSGVDVDQIKVVLGIAVAGAALLIIIPYIQMTLAKKEMESAKTRLDGIMSINDVMDDYYTVKAQYEDVNTFRKLTTNNNDVIMNFFSDMEQVMPTGVQITEFESEDGVVDLEGEAFSKYALAKYVQQLKSIDNVSDVFMKDAKESLDDNDNLVVEFELECVFTNEDNTEVEEEAQSNE
jgi:type IV pilus assembly protein PilM